MEHETIEYLVQKLRERDFGKSRFGEEISVIIGQMNGPVDHAAEFDGEQLQASTRWLDQSRPLLDQFIEEIEHDLTALAGSNKPLKYGLYLFCKLPGPDGPDHFVRYSKITIPEDGEARSLKLYKGAG